MSIIILLTVVEVCFVFSMNGIDFGTKTSGLRLASGSGIIARINTVLVDLPYAECRGVISSYPNGLKSANLIGSTESNGDDYSDIEGCKFLDSVQDSSTDDAYILLDDSDNITNLVGACNVPFVRNGMSEQVSLVIEGDNLLSVNSLLYMCQIDESIRSFDDYQPNYCRKQVTVSEGTQAISCCPSRSISNYVAALSNLTSCYAINDFAVSYTENLISLCRPSFLAGNLTGDCWDWTEGQAKVTQCPNTPPECTRYNAMYDMMHSLMGSDFVSSSSEQAKLKMGQLMVAAFHTSHEYNNDWVSRLYYEQLRDSVTDGNSNSASIVGLNLKIKSLVFRSNLKLAAVLLLPIYVICTFGIMMQGASLFVAIVAITLLFISFGSVMIVVNAVMDVSYFPFYAIMAFFVMLYVGITHLLLYISSWQDSFSSLEPLVSIVDRMSAVWHKRFMITFVSTISSR